MKRLVPSTSCPICPPQAGRVNAFLDYLSREADTDPAFLSWLENWAEREASTFSSDQAFAVGPPTGPPIIDITHIDLNNPVEIDSIRKDIEAMYQRVMPTLRYSPDTIKVQEVVMPCGAKARIGYVKNRPGYSKGEDGVSFTIRYKGDDYVLVFRGRPYTDFHIVLATGEISQAEGLHPDRFEVGLLMARILGNGSELFCNRVAPTSSNFHYQIIKSGHMSIWDEDLFRWPAYAIEKQGQDPFKLACEISDQVQQFRDDGAECDIFIKHDGTRYRVILIPRQVGDVYPSGKLGREEDFGTIGSLEMTGYFVSCRTDNSAELMMGNEGGVLWENALRELSYLNNERAKFVEYGNAIIASATGKTTSEDTEGVGVLDKNMATTEIKQKVEGAITAIEGLGDDEIMSEVKGVIESLKKNFNQFEADCVVGALIVLARKAKRENEKLYVGISTDWIPAYNNGHSLQHSVLNPLINELKAIPEALRSMGLDNIEFNITETSDALAADIIAKVNAGQIKPSNAVIIASKTSVESGAFDPIKSTDKEGRAFIAGIDSRILLELYNKYGESLGEQLNIDMLELLTLTLEVATGKEPPQMPLVISYDKTSRVLILLPSATIVDYDRLLRDVNKGRIQALQAA
jgi:hypothetical protein